MFSATETSSQLAANMPLPRQLAGANPMAWRIPSRRSHFAARASPAASSCSVEVTSISSTSGSPGSFRAVLLLGQLGHGEGQGGIGEDTGDEEPLAVQESHNHSERMRR